MKHLLNDMSFEERQNIREQHTGGMKVMSDSFRRLVNGKLGDSKPLVSEQVTGDTPTTVTGGGGFVDREKVDVINGVQIPKNQLGSDGKPETYINKLLKSYGKLNFKDDKGTVITGSYDYQKTRDEGLGQYVYYKMDILNPTNFELNFKEHYGVNTYVYSVDCKLIDGINKITSKDNASTRNDKTKFGLRELTFEKPTGDALKRFCKAIYPKNMSSFGWDVAQYDN
jgi:hypothetical protein